MKVCILGNNLTGLTLAKFLVNQNIYVDLLFKKKKFKFSKTRTLGISKSNVDFFNKNIINIKNLLWKLNKIEIFTETLYDYTNGYGVIENEYTNTDIAFSPNIIAAFSVNYTPLKGLNLMLQSKYVGQQFLDNTSNKNRVIDAYYSVDTRISYSLNFKNLKELTFNLMANNITNHLYSSNGYTYSYIYGDMVTENFYYPQAGINLLGGVTIKF